MSQPDGYASHLGQPADWGLTPDSFAPLRDELADHLFSLSEDQSNDLAYPESPEQIAQRLASSKSRRRLTAPRVTEQIRTTLHRWPTRKEWNELAWLLFWYALMMASDMVSAKATSLPSVWSFYFHNEPVVPAAPDQFLLWGAWILQGVARAGFFTAFGLSLYRAWNVGAGVLIARLLQLKLIHVILVILAGMFFSTLLAAFSGYNRNILSAYERHFQPFVFFGGPAWLTAPVVSGGLILIALLLVTRRQTRSAAAASALLAVFLYPGGPLASHRVEESHVWIKRGFYQLEDGALTPARVPYTKTKSDGTLEYVAAVDPERVRDKKVVAFLANTAENRRKYYEQIKARFKGSPGIFHDIPGNRYIVRFESFVVQPIGHIRTSHDEWWEWTEAAKKRSRERRQRELAATVVSADRLQGPLVATGAGLGWLAAPIPILTAIGLLLLLMVMGRRSVVDFVIYALLAGAAMLLTITPFFVGQRSNDILDLDPLGILRSPFPGFETLMVSSLPELMRGDYMDFTLILGLLLSSGVPWFLTATFLKPERSGNNAGPEVAA